MPAVAQGAPYQALATPGDDKATYAVAKRGGTEDVTVEAIKSDDIQALRRIPQELAFAAKNTLYEFVVDFYRGNPVIHDTKALYHVDHGKASGNEVPKISTIRAKDGVAPFARSNERHSFAFPCHCLNRDKPSFRLPIDWRKTDDRSFFVPSFN